MAGAGHRVAASSAGYSRARPSVGPDRYCSSQVACLSIVRMSQILDRRDENPPGVTWSPSPGSSQWRNRRLRPRPTGGVESCSSSVESQQQLPSPWPLPLPLEASSGAAGTVRIVPAARPPTRPEAPGADRLEPAPSGEADCRLSAQCQNRNERPWLAASQRPLASFSCVDQRIRS